jgi:hypothetical protein
MVDQAAGNTLDLGALTDSEPFECPKMLNFVSHWVNLHLPILVSF